MLGDLSGFSVGCLCLVRAIGSPGAGRICSTLNTLCPLLSLPPLRLQQYVWVVFRFSSPCLRSPGRGGMVFACRLLAKTMCTTFRFVDYCPHLLHISILVATLHVRFSFIVPGCASTCNRTHSEFGVWGVHRTGTQHSRNLTSYVFWSIARHPISSGLHSFPRSWPSPWSLVFAACWTRRMFRASSSRATSRRRLVVAFGSLSRRPHSIAQLGDMISLLYGLACPNRRRITLSNRPARAKELTRFLFGFVRSFGQLRNAPTHHNLSARTVPDTCSNPNAGVVYLFIEVGLFRAATTICYISV